jgi:hypothetical protein
MISSEEEQERLVRRTRMYESLEVDQVPSVSLGGLGLSSELFEELVE